MSVDFRLASVRDVGSAILIVGMRDMVEGATAKD